MKEPLSKLLQKNVCCDLIRTDQMDVCRKIF